uniref:Uncharacterized protein n=1 Tax=Anguilla anguilla TaxID=7936 RepID=A0A0E9V801_ANGAN
MSSLKNIYASSFSSVDTSQPKRRHRKPTSLESDPALRPDPHPLKG